MNRRQLLVVCATVIATATAACGGAAPSPVQTTTPPPAASSFEEYAVAACSAWEALFLAVGNPDTGEGSVLSKALDAAVAAHDGPKAEQLGEQIVQALESGRQDIAVAGGWQPATPILVQLDRVFIGFEAMTDAKVASARGDPNAVDPQMAFEASGAIAAWLAMFDAYHVIDAERPAEPQPCGDLPVSP